MNDAHDSEVIGAPPSIATDAILDQLPTLICFVDAEQRYRYANRAYLKWRGITSADLIGKPVREILGTEAYEDIREYLEEALRGHRVAYERTLTIRGKARIVEAVYSPVRGVSGGPVQGLWARLVDVTERKQAARRSEHSAAFLRLINDSTDARSLVRAALKFFEDESGCCAVSIRLKDGEDYPYLEATGFSREFLLNEGSLCARNAAGEVLRDASGAPVLECMCGDVICGRFDPALPYFTRNGTFWTNNASKLAATAPAGEPLMCRGHCLEAGCESLALLPLRVGQDRLGLLQINDRRKGMFTSEAIAFWERLAGYLAVALAKHRAEAELEVLARFPAESPNPVLRLRNDGLILYANPASQPLLAQWGCVVGDRVPDEWRRLVNAALVQGLQTAPDCVVVDCVYSFLLAPVAGAGYVNLYGRDIAERTRAAQALRESEERFRAMAETVPAIFFTCTADGACTYVSPQFAEYTGIACAAALGDGWAAAVHAEDRERVLREWRRVVEAGTPFVSEYRLRGKDGKCRWFMSRGRPVRDEREVITQWYGAWTDIQELKTTQEQFEHSRERFALAHDIAQIGTVDWDIQANRMCWSRELEALYGVASGCFEGTYEAWMRRVHPEDRLHVEQELQRAIAGQLSTRGVGLRAFRVVWPDGSTHWLEMRARVFHDRHHRPLYLIGVHLDITYMKLSEERLQRAKLQVERDESVLRAVTEGTARVTGEKFFPTLVRTLAETLHCRHALVAELTGIPPHHARPLAAWSGGRFVEFAEYPLGQSACRTVTEKTFLHCPAGVRQQFPDSPIPARLGAESYCGFCLYDSAARPIGILSVMDDKPMPDPSLAESVLRIFAARAGAEVERLRAEDEARRLEKRMHEMRKLESLGVLAGGIAHDFNNLLAVIQGNMELLLLDTPPDSQASPMLKAVEASALKAAHLCRQMVAYAGKAHISMNEVDFNLLVRDVCGSQWVCTARNVRAKYELAAALPGIHADPRQLSYILLYLLTNAEEAIGEHDGVITVRTGVMRCDREYLLQTHGEDEPAVGEYAFLEVADTGCGMSGDVKARLFEPFFTTKFPGRGLGLAAVHGIVHAHKGAIHVESECGKGTTVRVLFPVA